MALAKGGGYSVMETHISWVLLGDRDAFKIKKPVKFSFLDFTTAERRKEACEEEVRLNRRLAPDVYYGVVPVTVPVARSPATVSESAGGDDDDDNDDARGAIPSFGGSGRPIDWAVKMKRLPQERRMDLLLEKGAVTGQDIRKIASTVAAFHFSIDRIRDPRCGSADLVKSQIDDLSNFRPAIIDACGAGMGARADFVLSQSDAFIDDNRAAFRNRQSGGMIRDCHGDLHSANIFIMGDGRIVIFDCIEFNRDFRFIDTASEVAFMAMDLDAFGREDLSAAFIAEYSSRTKDLGLDGLLGLYKCYRANVRAKVAAIDWMQGKSPDAKARIEKYLLLAERYARHLPGTGGKVQKG